MMQYFQNSFFTAKKVTDIIHTKLRHSCVLNYYIHKLHRICTISIVHVVRHFIFSALYVQFTGLVYVHILDLV